MSDLFVKTPDGEVHRLKQYGWDGDDFVFETEDGEVHRLVNAYPADIKFEGLDYDGGESATIECMVQWSRNGSPEEQQAGQVSSLPEAVDCQDDCN